jgi:phospholipase/lecithinase/hemolysin
MGVKRLACAVSLTAALLAGCGGGELVQPFSPARQLSFGDESSALTDTGHNYGVNGINATTGAFDCTLNPNWVQYLASNYGFVFAQCNPGGLTPQAVMYAVAGAKAADLAGQIDAHLAGSSIGKTDLVTIMVGANDILEQYALFPATDEATLDAELRRRGALVAEQVNRIAALEGRTLIATVHDLGYTPFAVAEEAANPGRAALLTRLTAAFNSRMRATLINDGRRTGIVLSDDLVQAIAADPEPYGYVNVTQAACAVAPPDCTTATLVPGGSAGVWLWAGSTLLSASGQLRLGDLAVSRARNNPF